MAVTLPASNPEQPSACVRDTRPQRTCKRKTCIITDDEGSDDEAQGEGRKLQRPPPRECVDADWLTPDVDHETDNGASSDDDWGPWTWTARMLRHRLVYCWKRQARARMLLARGSQVGRAVGAVRVQAS